MRRLARWLAKAYFHAKRELLRDPAVTLIDHGPEYFNRAGHDGAAAQ